MSSRTTFETALCLIPPENLWGPIQEIRAIHDKAFVRWMPHINLIYPFAVENLFDTVVTRLESALEHVSPFEIEFGFNSFEYFKQKGSSCTFHLRPQSKQEINELEKIISKSLTEFIRSTKPFEAHLTLGQTVMHRISDMFIELKSKWSPIKYKVDRVYLISRQEDPDQPFKIKREVLLGGEKTDTISTPMPVTPPATIITQTQDNSELQLCIVPSDEFTNRILFLFEGTSFVPMKPFRVVLKEYHDVEQIEKELEETINGIRKFSLSFGKRSICFNYTTSRLMLKPEDSSVYDRFQLNKNLYDGNLTIGTLDKKEVEHVCQRYTDKWTFGTDEFEISQVHIIDQQGRFRFTYSLKSQCFS